MSTANSEIRLKMDDSDFFTVVDHSVPNFAWIGLKQLFYESKTFDIKLVGKDGEVSAHRVILASVSTYIKSYLSMELASHNVTAIDLSTYEVEVLNQLVDFIYTGEITLTRNNLYNVVELVDFLGVDILRHHLTYYMISTLNDSNCWEYCEISERHFFPEVFDQCDLYIRSHFTKLITGRRSEFLNAPPSQLLSLFNDDFLGVADHELFLVSLCEWMGHAPVERLVYLEKLLSQVDVARIPSWRGIPEKLSACFPPEHQTTIKEWAEAVGDRRDNIERRYPLKEAALEVIFLIGGVIAAEVVPSTDVFVPPLILFRVLPKSADVKKLVVIPPMHKKRTKPTAVSTRTSVYVIGGVHNNEELKAEGISCEVYRIKENKWHLLPSLPQNKWTQLSRNRVAPAAYAGGSLYAALPSPKSSFWILSKGETCWEQCSSPSCYEIFDLVSLSGAVYCLGKEYEDSSCYLLERYESYSQTWCRITVCCMRSHVPEVKCLSLGGILYVTSGDHSLKFDPHKSDWKPCQLTINCGDVLPSLCSYKGKQIVSLRFQEEDPFSAPSLEIITGSGSSDFHLPVRSSAALASVLIPVMKPEPI